MKNILPVVLLLALRAFPRWLRGARTIRARITTIRAGKDALAALQALSWVRAFPCF